MSSIFTSLFNLFISTPHLHSFFSSHDCSLLLHIRDEEVLKIVHNLHFFKWGSIMLSIMFTLLFVIQNQSHSFCDSNSITVCKIQITMNHCQFVIL